MGGNAAAVLGALALGLGFPVAAGAITVAGVGLAVGGLITTLIDGKANSQSNAALEATLRATFNLAENQASPIILDLDRDGEVETTPRDAAGTRVFFDLDNSGYAERSGWVGADDGLLVRDLNANGQIDSGAELFGNHTMLANGTRASNGFQALAELDTNHDGLINSYDAEAVASLRVWRDADGDGQTDAGELLTFEQAGVQALNVGYTDHGTRTPLDPQGNQHRQTGSYVVAADGSTRSMNEVWFAFEADETGDINTAKVIAEVAVITSTAIRPDFNRPHLSKLAQRQRKLNGLKATYPSRCSASHNYSEFQ